MYETDEITSDPLACHFGRTSYKGIFGFKNKCSKPESSVLATHRKTTLKIPFCLFSKSL